LVVDANDNEMPSAIVTKEQFSSITLDSCNNQPPIINSTCTLGTSFSSIPDKLTASCNYQQNLCGFTATHQQWLWCPPEGQPVVIGTIGDLQVYGTYIFVNGNSVGFVPGTHIYP